MPRNATIAIKHVSIRDLKPAAYNPRRHAPEAIGRLKESIKRFGLIDPIIANAATGRKNVVIGGHMRLKAAKELGHESVPVVYVTIPDVAKEKELNLRLNRNVGEWDFELLKDFDPTFLTDIGFDDGDLSGIWDAALDVEDDRFDVDKELDKIGKNPKTRLGDFYQLGHHRLLCGSATDEAAVMKLTGKERVPMIYCDPPYNISLDYDKGLGSKKRYGGSTDDAKPDTEYRAFLGKTISNALAVAAPDVHAFYWCDQRYTGMLQSIFEEAKLTNRRTCLWIKNNINPTPKVAFNKAYEPVVYASRGRPYLADSLKNLNEVLNKEIGTGNRLTDDILDQLDIWLVRRLPVSEYQHPTQKPPTLHEKALRRCTRPGDAVLDLFGGSGSTLVACEQLKRRCYATEIEPIFCDVIIKRYEALTGEKAKLIS